MITADERAVMQETVRTAIEAAATANGDIDAVLTQVGWLEMLSDEPDEAIAIVFRALGTANAAATALDDVLASALGQKPCADLAVLLPRFAAWDPPGRIDAGHLQAEGIATHRTATADRILMVCDTDSELASVIVPMTAVERNALHGVDPDSKLHSVRIRTSVAAVTRLDSTVWQSAIALGRRAVAHQIEGSCRTMLDLARTHALQRVQFGRPIARFQAVRHKLAEVLVAVESLDAALTAAREAPSPETAALAKAIAGRAALTVTRHCQQVLAGIGFTTDHRFHRFLKRVLLLEGILGSADEIVMHLGRKILAERRVPSLIEL